jgi:hypothetical protein
VNVSRQSTSPCLEAYHTAHTHLRNREYHIPYRLEESHTLRNISFEVWVRREQQERTGTDPDYIDAYGADVVQLRHDAFEVTNAIAIAVFETGRVDLVHDGILPPWSLNNSHLV